MNPELSRRTWLQSTLALGALSGCSGLRIGAGSPRYSSEEQLAPEALQKIKEKTTVFILQPGDGAELATFRSLLQQAWTMTPLEVVMPDQVDQFKDTTRYQYFTVDIFYDTDGLPEQYGLVLVDSLGEGSGVQGYCRYPLSRVLDKRVSHFEYRSVGPKERQYYNWHPSTLALYLRSAQRDLESGVRRSIYDDRNDTPRWASLKQDTLYVPDYALTPDKNSRALQNVEASEVFAEYPYRHQVVGVRALGELLNAELANKESSLFVLDCAFTGPERFVTLYNPASGIAYQRCLRFGATLTEDDVAELLDSVDG